MNIVLMTEGARIEMGGVGIVAVPPIARVLAQMGHRVVLETFGPKILGSEDFVTADPRAAFRENPVAITYPARGRYAFSPAAALASFDHIGRADFVMLHSLYSFAVLTGYLAARLRGKKYGIWPHGVLAPFQRTVNQKQKETYDALIANRILNDASVIFYNALGERDEAADLHLRAPSVIIPHGIDIDEFAHLPPRGAFRSAYMQGFAGPLVLYIGRLNAKKGIDVLIQAMKRVCARIPDARLALVGIGDPPEFTAKVQSWVQENGLTERVVMPGLLTGQAKLEALADADVFALASYAENFSFATFEAMASQLPVVISEAMNFAPQVHAQQTGIVAPQNPDAFADAIVTLLQDTSLRAQLGRNGARLAANYSWRTIGKQMERTIELLLADKPLPHELTLLSQQGHP